MIVPEDSTALTTEVIEAPPQSPTAPVVIDSDETISAEVSRAQQPTTLRQPVGDDSTIDETRPGLANLDIDLDPPFPVPKSLGGYRVGRRVGPTRLGATFEATQKSTALPVALAVVKPRWSTLAPFVARFAREAYASRQIEHPNLVKPLDLDIAKGTVYFVSEGLSGLPLSDPRAREGLDRPARTAAILHASRALRHAHEQGIFHRNVSLDKIRVDSSGMVMLADLGLGLTPETPEIPAIAPIAVEGPPGSAPSIPPESISAGFVREDISGLGRALQGLVGGSLGDRALPPGLATIVRRLTASGPDPSFTDLGAVVRAMEAELGVGGVFFPRESETAEFEGCVQGFHEPPLAKVRAKLILGSLVALGLFVGLAVVLGKPLLALGAVGFAAILVSSTVVLKGTLGRDPLFDRVRELLLDADRADGLTVLISLGLLVGVLTWTGLLGFWIFLGVVAVGLASATYFAIDRPVEQTRRDPVGRAVALIRGFRRLGIFEDSIRRQVCQQSGRPWEEFYERLFGYDAMRGARKRWGSDAGASDDLDSPPGAT